MSEEARSVNAFTFDLYQAAKSKAGNILISPINVAITLTMAWAGSEGKTAKQLAKALHMADWESPEKAVGGMERLMDSLRPTRDITLLLVNKVYAQKAVRIKKGYREMCVSRFKGDAEEIDFKTPDLARKAINQWVEKNTKGIFKDILPTGIIDQDTNLLLINAAYFKAGWWKSFDEANTKNETFTMADGQTVSVPMLHGNFQLSYHAITLLNATGITMSYKIENYAMVLLLPNSPTDLPQLEEGLKDLDFNELPSSAMEVYVTLPKFKLQHVTKLKEVLNKVGITDLFDKKADLSNITTETIFAKEVVQKVVLGITENGTEDGVISGEHFASRSMCEPVEFVANRPFLFVLKKDSDIIFMGRIADPSRQT